MPVMVARLFNSEKMMSRPCVQSFRGKRPTRKFREEARVRAQLALVLLWLVRVFVAAQRRERNRRWIVYIVWPVLAVPFWLLIEWVVWRC